MLEVATRFLPVAIVKKLAESGVPPAALVPKLLAAWKSNIYRCVVWCVCVCVCVCV